MKADIPDEAYTVPLDKANVVREGTDISLIAYSAQVNQSLKVAEKLEKEGISVEVVDLRTLSPLDEETILKSVQKDWSGRCDSRSATSSWYCSERCFTDC